MSTAVNGRHVIAALKGLAFASSTTAAPMYPRNSVVIVLGMRRGSGRDQPPSDALTSSFFQLFLFCGGAEECTVSALSYDDKTLGNPACNS